MEKLCVKAENLNYNISLKMFYIDHNYNTFPYTIDMGELLS